MPLDMPPQDIQHIRLDNLRRFIEKLGGRSNLTRAVERSTFDAKPTVSNQIISGWLLSHRAFGTDLCRRLELALELPRGWFDTRPVTDMSHTLPWLSHPQAVRALRDNAIPGEVSKRLAVPVDVVTDQRFVVKWGDDSMASGPQAVAPQSYLVVSLDEPVQSDHLVLAAVDGALLFRRLYIAGPQRLLIPASQRHGGSLDITERHDARLARVVLTLLHL